MKNLTLSLAFALTLTFGLVAQAQEPTRLTSAQEAQVTEQTREMAQKIGLNEREYITLRKLNTERIAQSAEIKAMYSNDAEMREFKLREIDQHFDARLLAVMNPKQQEAYATYKTSPDASLNIAGADEDDRSAEEQARDRK